MVNIEFGASTPRPSAEVCYTWAKMSGRAQQHSTTTRLFDAAMHWVSVLNISEEAAISIFFAMMQSREIINDKIDELEVILFDVICVIVKSYQNGFRYCSPIGGMKRALVGAEIASNLHPSSRMERPTFSRYLQMQNPDGKDTTFPDACPSLKTSQSRATMKVPMPGPSDQQVFPLAVMLARHSTQSMTCRSTILHESSHYQ
ncbi:hypothetical protein SEVIR_7G084300v4 [Setaria viridis]|uniref:Uncharacterized protein n=2 Tax=Setaria viridis TaxID=4556 RepID=A0A4U6TMW3_SETVI|nr:hypothetical protein SEVIR_7G084300v2 [Setaria viridis]